jgi:RHS repeat-associated protein
VEDVRVRELPDQDLLQRFHAQQDQAAFHTTLSSFDYRYDAADNRTRVAEVDGSIVTWSYDDAYQLTRAQRTGSVPYVITYAYNPSGNRLTKRDGGAPTTYIYDAANQLSTQKDATGTTSFAYDANGNQIRQTAPSGTRTTWLWDYENQLTGVRLASGAPNTFAYDADGRRVQRQDSGGTRKEIWDGANLLVETDQNDVRQATYTVEPVLYGNVISMRTGDVSGVVTYYHFDGLGSTDRLTNVVGTTTDTYVYEPFGSLRGGTQTLVNPFRYVGRMGYYFDPDLAQYYLRARHYESANGRFLSRDPLGFFHSPANPYDYVQNNPINFVDASGKFWWYAACVCGWGPFCFAPIFACWGPPATCNLLCMLGLDSRVCAVCCLAFTWPWPLICCCWTSGTINIGMGPAIPGGGCGCTVCI